MTTSLTVFTKPGSLANNYEVFWACGWRTQGTVSVSIACQVDAPEIAAELGVLRHLLEDREVCGSDRTGNSMKLNCRFGAVKKLAGGKSAKTSLAPFAIFPRTKPSNLDLEFNFYEHFGNVAKTHFGNAVKSSSLSTAIRL